MRPAPTANGQEIIKAEAVREGGSAGYEFWTSGELVPQGLILHSTNGLAKGWVTLHAGDANARTTFTVCDHAVDGRARTVAAKIVHPLIH